MIERAKLNLYKIDKCGYFEYGTDDALFGDSNEILSSLRDWIRDKQLQETKTYNEDQYENNHCTYCLDLISDEDTGDYIFTTWNETPTERGRFASVNGRSAVGEYDVDAQRIREGDIPGYATYFWFLPEFECFFTIRFNMPVNGHQQLRLFLKNFLKKYSKFVVDTEVENERVILGYRENGDQEILNLSPQFNSRPKTDQGNLNYLLSRQEDIRKVMKKSVLTYENEQESISTFFQFLRIGVDNVPAQDLFTVKYEVDFNPDEDAVRDLYSSWEEEILKSDNDWEDIGVQFKGNESDYWFSRILKKKEYDIDVEWESEAVVNANSLLQSLKAERGNIVEMI